MEAIVVERTGGPDVLVPAQVDEPVPADGEVVVDVSFAGVNFIDTYQRSGLYPMELPFVPGLEGAGTITAVGSGVDAVGVGDRVAWNASSGSYAERVGMSAGVLVLLPDAVDLDIAAAVMLQGITAHYLTGDTYELSEGDRCLIHAGAGGVGRLLVQLAKARGAYVFATVGSAEKADIASAAGADRVIDYSKADFREVVESEIGPRALDVVYDGVGRATFDGGLALLKPRGVMVAFGNASGPIPPVDPLRLMRGGSLYLTRPTMGDYLREPGELQRRTSDLFAMIEQGQLDVLIGARFALREAVAAHRALESRETAGKVLLEV